MKPHRGTIDYWHVHYYCESMPPIIVCTFRDHPYFAGERGHTSAVLSDLCDLVEGSEVETRNSRYTLGKPNAKRGRPHEPKA